MGRARRSDLAWPEDKVRFIFYITNGFTSLFVYQAFTYDAIDTILLNHSLNYISELRFVKVYKWLLMNFRLKLKWVYMYCAGFYTYSIFALIFWETRRSDFGVSMGHHVATVILIVLSYIFRYVLMEWVCSFLMFFLSQNQASKNVCTKGMLEGLLWRR